MTDTPDFSSLPLKQKAIAFLFLMLAIFAVWEIIGLFRGKNAAAAAAPASKPISQLQAQAVQPAAAKAPVIRNTQSAPLKAQPVAESTPPTTIVLTQQEQVQSKYVSALNELQMLKIQKEIAETSQAIVAAKLATTTAEKSITNLLSENEGSKNPPPQPVASPMEAGGGYSVQSVSMEQQQWHAVVRFKDRLYNVTAGDMLPPDRSIVKSIDQRGVTLDTGGMEQRVPLSVSDTVYQPASSNPALPSTLPPGVP